MKPIMKKDWFGWVIILILTFTSSAWAELPAKQSIVDTLRRVEDYWIHAHHHPGDNKWARATHFAGTMALFDIYNDSKYKDYALNWGELNGFELNGGDNTKNADNQCAGQAYLALNDIDPANDKIEAVKKSVDGMLTDPNNDHWYWIDALFMAMPVFAKLGLMEQSKDYFDKMRALYDHTKNYEGGKGLYSDNGAYSLGDYLWFRDKKYTPEGSQGVIYWSRGNGWVLAALARALEEMYKILNLPDIDQEFKENLREDIEEYENILKEMAASLRACQRTDGFWNVNLENPNDYGGKETSGTALITYAMAWAIRRNLLDRSLYQPCVEAAWNGMATHAVHPNGKLGYIQGVAQRPRQSQPVTYETTSDFGVGAFLLAGTEIYKLTTDPAPSIAPRTVYQAEDAAITQGSVASNHAGYTGTGFVDYNNQTGSKVTFTVPLNGNGRRGLLLRFANGGSAGRGMDIIVNGGDHIKENVPFDPTGAWTSWAYQNVNVDLRDGSNTIEIIAAQPLGGPNLDKIEIGDEGADPPPTWYAASDFSSVYDLGEGQNGLVTLAFDVMPFDDAIDGVVGYADSSVNISNWSSMALLVRMYTNGCFEVRNGSSYRKDKTVDYHAHRKYRVIIAANLIAQTYNVWVRPEGGSRTRIARDYSFRSDAPPTEDIGKVCLRSNRTQNFKVENHTP